MTVVNASDCDAPAVIHRLPKGLNFHKDKDRTILYSSQSAGANVLPAIQGFTVSGISKRPRKNGPRVSSAGSEVLRRVGAEQSERHHRLSALVATLSHFLRGFTAPPDYLSPGETWRQTEIDMRTGKSLEPERTRIRVVKVREADARAARGP